MERKSHLIKSTKKEQPISIEGLLLLQMQEQFGGDVTDFVQKTKDALRKMHPVRVKKIIFQIQNNLQTFMKGKKLGSGIKNRPSIKLMNYEKGEGKEKVSRLFNMKRLEEEVNKIKTFRDRQQCEGNLLKEFVNKNKCPNLLKNRTLAGGSFRKYNTILSCKENRGYTSKRNRSRKFKIV